MPFNTEDLPDLVNPDLKKARVAKLLQVRDLKDGALGQVHYNLGLKGAELSTKIKEAQIRALIGYDGNYGLKVNTPLWGGNLGFNYKHNDNGNTYGLNFQKRF